MAKKTYQSKASRAQRLAQNKGVKHGTVRTGAGGRTLRRYDSSTGRWNVVRASTGQGARSSKPPVTKPSKSVKGSIGKLTTTTSRVGMDSITRTRGSGITKPTTRATSNRPSAYGKGGAVRASTNKSGEQRWAKHVAPGTSWGSAKTSSFMDDPLGLKGNGGLKSLWNTRLRGRSSNNPIR